jgi:hypothetical protein
MATSDDITELRKTQAKLEEALTTAPGFVTICASGKNIRNASSEWVAVEQFLKSNSNDLKFSHGICPNCYDQAIQELKAT